MLSVINILGVGVGFLIPSAFVSDTSSYDESRSNFFSLLLTEAIMSTVMIAPVFFLFREKPPTPPRFIFSFKNLNYLFVSFGAETKKLSFKVAINTALKNKSFILLLITFSFVMGNYNCLATIVDLLIKPFGYDEVLFIHFMLY